MKQLPSKASKPLRRNYSAFTSDNIDVVVKEMQSALRDMADAIFELQNRTITDKYPDADGMPSHGNLCELLNGQYLRVNQTAASGQVVTIEHSLGRIPQAVVQLKSYVLPIIAGKISSNLAPASETSVSLELRGNSGDTHIFILI